MKKTQFFSEESTDKLQLAVNTWLSENKEINIIDSDMEVAGDKEGRAYAFYILYEGVASEAAISMAESMQQILPENVVLHENMIIPDNKDIQLQ